MPTRNGKQPWRNYEEVLKYSRKFSNMSRISFSYHPPGMFRNKTWGIIYLNKYPQPENSRTSWKKFPCPTAPGEIPWELASIPGRQAWRLMQWEAAYKKTMLRPRDFYSCRSAQRTELVKPPIAQNLHDRWLWKQEERYLMGSTATTSPWRTATTV